MSTQFAALQRRVSSRQLRSNLSALLKAARQGDEIVITSRGEEIARLVPPVQKAPRQLGLLKGQIWMAPDFDETPEDIIDAMEGRGEPG